VKRSSGARSRSLKPEERSGTSHLLVLKTQWLEHLQPFGDNGYKNRKGFEWDRQAVAHFQAIQDDAQ
jgi:hypothetical protein